MQTLKAMARGELSSQELVEDCIHRIRLREPEVHAWSYMDEDYALGWALERDQERARGQCRGVLHGVPVGIKDIIYTEQMPTQHNSPIYQGHWPRYDAACVKLLENAGAIIMGKLETVEFASMGRVAPTRNPLDLNRTPGGSSSGSAAAVADFMVPLSLGTQTGGSTIRPASFCGVYGMKPTYGLIPIEGIRPYAPSLDTIGMMARSLDDLGLLARALLVIEGELKAMNPSDLYIGLFRSSLWSKADSASQVVVGAVAEKLQSLGVRVEDVQSSIDFAELNDAQNIIMHGEGRRSFLADYGCHKSEMHPDGIAEAENKLGITGGEMRQAYDFIAQSRLQVEKEMQSYDAWLTPSVIGEAPLGLESTGEATFNRCWTALHSPCVTVPVSCSESVMPIGVQFVAPRFQDHNLLSVISTFDQAIKG